MKNFLLNPNTIAIMFSILSVLETFCLCLLHPDSVYLEIGIGVMAIVVIIINRFAYQLAKCNNRWYSRLYRKNKDEEDKQDYEPSNFAVLRVKLPCYIILAMQSIMLIAFSII